MCYPLPALATTLRTSLAWQQSGLAKGCLHVLQLTSIHLAPAPRLSPILAPALRPRHVPHCHCPDHDDSHDNAIGA